MAYETTAVSVEKSQGEIRKLLYAHGARNFSFSETEVEETAWAAVDFIHQEQRVRMRVPLKPIDQRLIAQKVQRAQTRTREEIERQFIDQEAKRIWRVIFHGLKARLVSVEEGVETFEEAFLAHLVDPMSGLTMWEAMKGVVESGALKVGGPGVMSAPLVDLALPAPSTPEPDADDDEIVDAEVVE